MDKWRSLRVRVRGNSYLSNVLKLVAGAGIAQIISLGLTPIVTRMYHPEQYGLAASYGAIVGIVGPIAALRYDFAIVLSESDEEASDTLKLCFALAAITSLITTVAIIAIWARSALPLVRGLGWIVLLLPASVFVVSGAEIVSNWANRNQRYDLLARRQILTSAVSSIVAIGTASLLGSRPLGLILAALLSVAAGAAYLGRTMSRRGLLSMGRHVSLARLRALMKKYRQFPLFNLWITLLDTLTLSLPVLVFGIWFSPALAAYFALANSVLQLPAGLIGGAVGQVFYERAARHQHTPEELRRLLARNVVGLSLLAAVPLVAVVGFGPTLFALVFGSSWREAGGLARFLAVGVGFMFVASPVSRLPSVLGQQHKHLAIALFAYAGRVVALGLGARAHSPYLAVGLYSLSEATTSLALLVWLWRHLRRAGGTTVASVPVGDAMEEP